ncbi:sodium/bile acid cotransporter 5 [Nilaparvata lugens]|uniref:sodium/bile acid cotransporter 5 n=1 Tax=Nilaparvata lugens TaxID=108931 RepID=UPI00193DA012|nr:sodium/bile acid cotransporter 5 [Nilaparvata lugens]XP_039292214.1 sodium/bile acid cotransporter 5 [Nilaparvata lugens]
MCPLWPVHTIIMYLLVLLPLWLLSCSIMHVSASKLTVDFIPTDNIQLPMSETAPLTVIYQSSDFTPDDKQRGNFYLLSDRPGVVSVPAKDVFINTHQINNMTFMSVFNVSANFLGYASVKAVFEKDSEIRESEKTAKFTVVRQERPIDRMFLISVIVLVFILYINFGCALDLEVLMQTIKRPIGPAIGVFCQFIVMPIIGFLIGQLLFKDSTALQLGFFFTGIVPAGGASNIWTCILGGNLNLSITMTTVSTFTAFLLIPFWSFTLGRVIFANGNMMVPYGSIARSAISLIIPLVIGAFLQFHAPKFSKLMVRILKPFSAALLLFIIAFAIVTNLYLFKLFTWQIALAGFCLPFFGYLFGGIIARLLNQKPEDSLAVSIETGVQNTGVAIFMLRYSLGQPEADITTVAPVAVAIMTPIPLILLHLLRKCLHNQIYSPKNSQDAYSEKITTISNDDYLTAHA